MNARTNLNRIGLSALVASLTAGRLAYAGPPPVVAHPRPVAVAVPVARARPRLGAAPKAEFKVNNHSFPIDPKEKAVQKVRAMSPRNYEPAARRDSVDGFYKKQFADKNPPKEKLANLYVGPFRREFVWWAWHGWGAEDRAAWAWNNYSYFDPLLWNQWMADEDFKQRIAKYDAKRASRVPGFVPQQYLASEPEVMYNDEYIDAVYNPVYTTPSIVVDGSAGARLENLIQGAPRTFGVQGTTIDSLADSTNGLQFLSVPAKFDPTYQIEIKRDGILYIFGPTKTPLQEGVGDDAPRWSVASHLITGSGIQAIYQRKVTAGEKIRIHGYEWSIASEQIDVLDTASPAATTAVAMVDAEIGQMLKSDDAILQSEPELKDYLRIAQGAEQGLLTPLGNVDEEKIGLYYAALDKVQKMSVEATSQSNDHKVVASAKELTRQVTGLEESLNDVDELRNPDANSSPEQPLETVSGTGGTGDQSAKPQIDFPQTSGSIDLLSRVDVAADAVGGNWTRTEAGIQSDESRAKLKLNYVPAGEYDFTVKFTRVSTSGRGGGDVALILVHDKHRFAWDMTNYARGFDMVDGQRFLATPSNKSATPVLKNGTSYVVVVKMRNDSVTATINGDLVGELKTDYSNVSIYRPFDFQTDSIGLVSWYAGTLFQSAKVTLVDHGPDQMQSLPPAGSITVRPEKTAQLALAQSLTVGSKWVPIAGSQHPGDSMTVISFDGTSLALSSDNGHGDTHRWNLQVDAQGKFQVSDIQPIKVPKNASVISDIHISGSVTADTMTFTGSRRRQNVDMPYNMTFKPQQ